MRARNQAADQKAEKIIRPPVRVGYTIADAVARRVKAAALATDRSQSEIVEEALIAHVGGYYVTHRGVNGRPESGETESVA